METNEVLVIIPAFNEEKNISLIIEDIKRLPFHLEILVVNDGSNDYTAEYAKKAGAIVISLPFNLGYGVAIQTGFKYALYKNYKFIIHMDADGQHEVRSIIDLKKEIEEGKADIIIGSRFLKNPNYPLVFFKSIGIKIFRFIVKLITKQNITDPTSGFQALNRKAFELYSYIYPSDFPDTDIIIASYLLGLKIAEIPVKIYPKHFGKSMHSGFKPVYYIYKMFLSILVTILRKYPGNISKNKYF